MEGQRGDQRGENDVQSGQVDQQQYRKAETSDLLALADSRRVKQQQTEDEQYQDLDQAA